MSLEDMQAKFKNSQLALFGWRSKETAIAMNKRMHKTAPPPPPPAAQQAKPSVTDYSDGTLPTDIMAETKDVAGNVVAREPDVSKMNSAQALKHMNSMGFKLPMIVRPPVKR
jgi:hypothetical protein